MSETQTPAPSTTRKHRASIASRILSPTTPFFIGSNDDNLERARARAARAASVRRKSVVSFAPPPPPDPCLQKEQILELFHNCIKLASENKINQKNTWELKLIDHLSDIIKVEEENESNTSFQKASCSLEAGVKIYSVRVDSVHSEAYKVLGGITRASYGNEKSTSTDDGGASNDIEANPSSKKEPDKKLSLLSTLESSFEALNVKKFDVAFTVDPLYHQTTAQFDEGGAKGLLLNNLGVYGFCRVLFDSSDVPGNCLSPGVEDDETDMIDLTFLRDCIETMVRSSHTSNDICPSLRHIITQLDGDNPSSSGERLNEEREELNDDAWVFEQHGYGPTFVEEGVDPADSSSYQGNLGCDFGNGDVDDRFEGVDDYLLLGLGLASTKNSWAGPDYWKYQKPKVESVSDEEGLLATKIAKRKKKKKRSETDIDFTNCWTTKMSNLLDPPKKWKSLSLPPNRLPANTKLPEDCHYQPMNLVKLFLLPNVLCLGRRRRVSDEEYQEYDDSGPQPAWEDEADHSDTGDTLISPPRQVNTVEVEYDKTSKQVDVQALKEALWDCIKQSSGVSHEAISFRKIVREFRGESVSTHLCFICLLHLANEHGLIITGCTSMDDLSILLSPDTEGDPTTSLPS